MAALRTGTGRRPGPDSGEDLGRDGVARQPVVQHRAGRPGGHVRGRAARAGVGGVVHRDHQLARTRGGHPRVRTVLVDQVQDLPSDRVLAGRAREFDADGGRVARRGGAGCGCGGSRRGGRGQGRNGGGDGQGQREQQGCRADGGAKSSHTDDGRPRAGELTSTQQRTRPLREGPFASPRGGPSDSTDRA